MKIRISLSDAALESRKADLTTSFKTIGLLDESVDQPRTITEGISPAPLYWLFIPPNLIGVLVAIWI